MCLTFRQFEWFVPQFPPGWNLEGTDDKEPGQFPRSQNWIGGTRRGTFLAFLTCNSYLFETLEMSKNDLSGKKCPLPMWQRKEIQALLRWINHENSVGDL